MSERTDLGEDTPSLTTSRHSYLRGMGSFAVWVAILSSLYHMAAVYLLPLPAEMHPNMHVLLAFVILLVGGFATRPEAFGEGLKSLHVLPLLYLLSLGLAAFFFYFVSLIGKGWTVHSVWWAYALPLVIWAVMMIRERARLALGLWLLSMVPSAFLFAYWGSLPASVQSPRSWWLLLSASVPVGWVLFEVFYRPRE
ncbi:MAG: hypothetical protein HYY66_08780, partial [Candidatus Tectomicrobia bacterium]|nr:hypothetical protein [Candidatus Tectomicrobia bacterium]